MATYLVRRALMGLFVLWAAFTVAFVMLYVLPGDPLLIMLGGSGDVYVSEEQLAELRRQYGMDASPIGQYFDRMLGMVVGDFGTSLATRQPVADMIGLAMPETLELAALALGISVILGLGIALLATFVQAGWLRGLLLALPPVGVSLPTFWVGLMLLQFFSFGLGWFPAVGNQGWESLVLPAVTIALPTTAIIVQILVQSLESQWSQPYVEVVRAKGFGRAATQMRHVFRNAVIPTLTMLGVITGGLLGGAVVTETVFSRVGIGRLIQSAVITKDMPVLLSLVVLAAAIFVLVNLAVDVLYPLIDPRMAQRIKRGPATR